MFLRQDHFTRLVYRLYEFTKSHQIGSDHFYCVSGKVNSADKLYLVIESVKRDNKQSPEPQLRLEWGGGSEAMNYSDVGKDNSTTQPALAVPTNAFVSFKRLLTAIWLTSNRR